MLAAIDMNALVQQIMTYYVSKAAANTATPLCLSPVLTVLKADKKLVSKRSAGSTPLRMWADGSDGCDGIKKTFPGRERNVIKLRKAVAE